MVTRLRNDVLEVGGGNISGMIYSDIAARNAIPTNARHEGMVVRLKNGERYSLGANLTNSDWVTLPSDGYEFSSTNFGSTFENDITLYVRADGYDYNDGRTSNTAFLTIQRALDVLPIHLTAFVLIDVGPGTFEGGVVKSITGESAIASGIYGFGGQINIRGTTTDLETVSVVSDNGLVSGKACQRDIDIGAYSTTIIKGTHFIKESSGLGPIFDRTYWAISGSSPSVVLVGANTKTFSNATLSTLATTITSPISGSTNVTSLVHLQNLNISFSGAKFFNNVRLDGCKISGSVNQYGEISNIVDSYIDGSVKCENTGSITNTIVNGDVTLAATENSSSTNNVFSGVINTSSTLHIQVAGFLVLSDVDFEGVGIRCILSYYQSSINFIGDASCTGTGIFLDLRNGATVDINNHLVFGTVTNQSSLSDGSKVLNASNVTLSNTSSPGSDIVVGNGATATTWADIPITDLTTMCLIN